MQANQLLGSCRFVS